MNGILLHHNESELSRTLLDSAPEGLTVADFTGGAPADYSGPQPSAFPSVVVDVPAYSADTPMFGQDGEFLGMARMNIPAQQEAVRMPASWEIVDSYVGYVQARAVANPPV